jgi:hypothetical protein
MAQPKLQLQFAHSAVLRYGLAVVSVAIALAIALILQHYEFHDVALANQACGLLLNALSFWRNPEGHPSSAANFTFALGQAHGQMVIWMEC